MLSAYTVTGEERIALCFRKYTPGRNNEQEHCGLESICQPYIDGVKEIREIYEDYVF